MAIANKPRPTPAAQGFSKSRALQPKAHAIIPGGAHTYAKGGDQYPEQAPAFIVRGKGCHVWDVDGNEFVEFGMGLRAVTLGHAFEPVVQAAYKQMQLGANFTRPAKIEVDAAEAFLQIIDGADMMKFAKNGSDLSRSCRRRTSRCSSAPISRGQQKSRSTPPKRFCRSSMAPT